MKRCAIAIPCYKENLTNNEKIALVRCLAVLGNYDIYIVCPEGIQADFFSEVTGLKYYSPDWFSDRMAYSDFMLAPDFYESFIDYEYVLIYQLDAFVFNDKLEYFCDCGYDYIGASWTPGLVAVSEEDCRVIHVGNGGFSLRRTRAFADWTRMHAQDILKVKETTNLRNEDAIISYLDGISIAPVDVADEFAIEDIRTMADIDTGKIFGSHNIYFYDFFKAEKIYRKYGYSLELPAKTSSKDLDMSHKKAFVFENNLWKFVGFEAIKQSLPGAVNSVTIWGTGNQGVFIYYLCRQIGLEIECFIESVPKKNKFYGIEVKPARPYLEKERRENVIIAFINNQDARVTLNELQYIKGVNYTRVDDIISCAYELGKMAE